MRTAVQPSNRRVWVVYLLVVCVLIIYLSFLTRTYYWDGVLFSLNIESVYKGDSSAFSLVHPNHLLYSGLGYVLYSTALAAGLHLRAITVLQISNAGLGAACAFVIYLLASRLTQTRSLALVSALTFAVGANWWKYATDADPYIVCILLLLLASFFLLDNLPRFVPVAVCHSVAMLFHELAIFFYIPVVVAVWLNTHQSKVTRIRTSIAYVMGSGVCVAVVYGLCYARADHHVYPSLASWISSYDTAHSRFTHSISEIEPYFAGYLRLFFGGRFSLFRKFVSVPMLLAFGTCLVALGSAVFAWRHPQSTSGAPLQNGKSRIVLWAWLFIYAIFLASWDPGSTFHKLFLWPPIVLLIASFAGNRPALRQRTSSLLAIAVAMATWNFAAFIYPHSRLGADPVLGLANTINRELPRKATIFYTAPNADSWYLQYFAPGRRWIMLPRDPMADRQIIGSTKGAVCVDTTAIDPFESDLDPDAKWNLVDSHHNVKLECRVDAKR